MNRRSFLQTILVCCLLLLASATATAQPRPGDTGAAPATTGIVLLAHGSNDERWNAEVRRVAAQVDQAMPTEVAFGMATRATIQQAADRLLARGVGEIVAVPLFVSSHSSVIDSTAYLLGLRADAPEDLAMFAAMAHGAPHGAHGTAAPAGAAAAHPHHHPAAAPSAQPASAEAVTPISLAVPVRMAPALDHHPIVAQILGERAASISRDPVHETVLLVAHGPVRDAEDRLWLDDMRQLAAQMQAATRYAGIECLTLRDDAGPEVRDAATQRLRQQVERATAAGNTVLVVPLLLSYGGIEQGLRERLQGLAYRMPAQALLPDARIAAWVLDSARAQAGDGTPASDGQQAANAQAPGRPR